mmetsp:Transcript_10597/g.949  ORF Transcript_10597/g.949 Transcript_10597/m.949 type:complete len:89 (+) Transcript_10597:643-909(+)
MIDFPIFGEIPIGMSIAWFIIIGAIVSTPAIFKRIHDSVGTKKLLESFKKTWFMFYAHGVIMYFNVYSEISHYAFRYAIMFLGFNMCK